MKNTILLFVIIASMAVGVYISKEYYYQVGYIDGDKVGREIVTMANTDYAYQEGYKAGKDSCRKK